MPPTFDLPSRFTLPRTLPLPRRDSFWKGVARVTVQLAPSERFPADDACWTADDVERARASLEKHVRGEFGDARVISLLDHRNFDRFRALVERARDNAKGDFTSGLARFYTVETRDLEAGPEIYAWLARGAGKTFTHVYEKPTVYQSAADPEEVAFASTPDPLENTPAGIGAKELTSVIDAVSTNLRLAVIDLEWRAGHPDLNTPAGADIVSLPGSTPKLGSHGVKSIGVIAARKNAQHARGIVPSLPEVRLFGGFDAYGIGDPAADFLLALQDPTLPDVLLFEYEQNYTLNGLANRMGPPEVIPETRELVELATKNGVLVVQPAGNQGRRLEAMTDSGAVIVAAGRWDASATVVAADKGSRWKRRSDSNHGARIDCFAQGDGIPTLDLVASATDTYTPGTSTFTQTSAASAVIAGAALAVKGMRQAKGLSVTPAAIRAELKKGIPKNSAEPATIGVMPNLRKLSQAYGLA